MLHEYLIFAVLSIAMRFLPNYAKHDEKTAEAYAAEAWKTVSAQSFDGDKSPDYQLVQATTLLAIFDFTGMFGSTFRPSF